MLHLGTLSSIDNLRYHKVVNPFSPIDIQGGEKVWKPLEISQGK